MPRRPDYLSREDGLKCRQSGEWAQTKLSFLDDYVPPALAVTHKMPRRWFVDLFAGPGRNVILDRAGYEFPGSPIRALGYTAPRNTSVTLTDAVFVNKEPEDHTALSARVERACSNGSSRIPLNRIRLRNEDANSVITDIMSQIPRRDYVIAFVDITGAEHLPFTTIRELKRQGHLSVDMYLLFPLEMTLIRKLSFDESMTERYSTALTGFFDGDEWRAIRDRRYTSAQGGSEMKRAVTELYLAKLRELWTYADVQHNIYMGANRPLYRMIFASNHPIADRLATWQKRHDQGELFGG